VSESACAGDPDGGSGGASACDPDKGRRPLDRALKLVWASLWDFGAFEEREYYQIDHRDVAMGVLVSTRYEDERANGVAFTGNPIDVMDGRYTINVQLGEVDVVSPPPGTIAELDRVTVTDGEVVAIDRVAASSLVKPGEVVLSDAQLEELGALLAEIAASYPIDPGEHAPEEVLLDLEFKVSSTGTLVIKQIRPFLRGAGTPSLPATCLD
jgi:phosphoenolpyruvate synthase/pyruvate phosphate dikinase